MHQLQTMELRTPQALHARLSEMEKIDLRRASPDRIDYLFYSRYCHEVAAVEDLAAVKLFCDKEMADYDALQNLDAHSGVIPSTWRF